METTKYTVDNSITFRVANTDMDTVLKSMVKEIDFLNNRLIKADDVSLQMLSNKLAQKRIQKSQNRLEKGIDKKVKELDQIVDAKVKVLDKETDSDSQLLNTLSLEAQVSFSTVTLYLHQSETTKHELIANDKNARCLPDKHWFAVIGQFKNWLVYFGKFYSFCGSIVVYFYYLSQLYF